MRRLQVLIVEVEQPEGLSSRKLIIESMKHNVVTAYSGQEALDLLARLQPDMVLVHRNVTSPSCAELLSRIKEEYSQLPITVISPTRQRCSIEDHVLGSMEPSQLVSFINEFSQQVTGGQPADHSTTRTVDTHS